jgi:hypothetical protein
MSELKFRRLKEPAEPPRSKAPTSEGGRYTSEEKNGPKNRPEGTTPVPRAAATGRRVGEDPSSGISSLNKGCRTLLQGNQCGREQRARVYLAP